MDDRAQFSVHSVTHPVIKITIKVVLAAQVYPFILFCRYTSLHSLCPVMHPATTELGESLSTLFLEKHMNVTGRIKAYDLLQSRYE